MPLVSDPTFGAGTQLVLDPSEVAAARTEFPLNTGAMRVGEGGPDWGDAQISAYMAEAARGELPVDFRIPNRQIKIFLVVGANGPADFDTQRRYLQAKVGLIQREGGWLKRQDPGGDPVYLDVVNATLNLPDVYGHLGVEANVVLTLEAIPDFYGDEVALTDHSETAMPELVFTETGIEGDYPGRLRLVVDNDGGADWLGLVACVRSRHYDPAATARLAYEAEALTPLDAAAVGTLAGASGGSAVKHLNLGIQWTPVLSTNLLAGTFLTHQGSYRVRARVWSTSAVPPALRFVWDVGDLVFPEENNAWLIPGASNFYLADLGEIRLDPVSAGAHRWQGQVQGKGAAGGENVWIDRLWLEPLDEGHAKLAAPINNLSGGFIPPSGRDEFNQTAGALNGKAAVGDDWSTAGASGDFTVNATDHVLERTEIADSDFYAGRFAFFGSTSMEATVVRLDFKRPLMVRALNHGVVARYSGLTHHLVATYANDSLLPPYLLLWLRTAAGDPVFIGAEVLDTDLAPDTFYTLQLLVTGSGLACVWLAVAGGALGHPRIVTQDSRLATGGALASGAPGIYDACATSDPVTRTDDNFLTYVPTLDAVAYAAQSAQLGTDGNVREDSTGSAYGPVSIDGGDLLRLPPSGLEERTIEVMVKPSRGDLDHLPDSGIDDVSAQAFYRPSYLTLPW